MGTACGKADIRFEKHLAPFEASGRRATVRCECASQVCRNTCFRPMGEGAVAYGVREGMLLVKAAGACSGDVGVEMECLAFLMVRCLPFRGRQPHSFKLFCTFEPPRGHRGT